MDIEQLLATIRGLPGVLHLNPTAGSDHPEVSWGDHFFYYAPDGRVPERTQPYATIVTKDYPGDTLSELDPPGRWRVNIAVGRARFIELTGTEPRDAGASSYRTADVILPHPVYASAGWIAVVNPGDATSDTVVQLVRAAHADAERRAARRRR